MNYVPLIPMMFPVIIAVAAVLIPAKNNKE
jgi:hypothetical protein